MLTDIYWILVIILLSFADFCKNSFFPKFGESGCYISQLSAERTQTLNKRLANNLAESLVQLHTITAYLQPRTMRTAASLSCLSAGVPRRSSGPPPGSRVRSSKSKARISDLEQFKFQIPELQFQISKLSNIFKSPNDHCRTSA